MDWVNLLRRQNNSARRTSCTGRTWSTRVAVASIVLAAIPATHAADPAPGNRNTITDLSAMEVHRLNTLLTQPAWKLGNSLVGMEQQLDGLLMQENATLTDKLMSLTTLQVIEMVDSQPDIPGNLPPPAAGIPAAPAATQPELVITIASDDKEPARTQALPRPNNWMLVLASLGNETAARQFMAKTQAQGITAQTVPIEVRGKPYWRVIVPFDTRDAARANADEIRQTLAIPDAWIARVPPSMTPQVIEMVDSQPDIPENLPPPAAGIPAAPAATQPELVITIASDDKEPARTQALPRPNNWMLVLASLGNETAARQFMAKTQAQGITAQTVPIEVRGKPYWRVIVPFDTRDAARANADEIRQTLAIPDAWIARR